MLLIDHVEHFVGIIQTLVYLLDTCLVWSVQLIFCLFRPLNIK